MRHSTINKLMPALTLVSFILSPLARPALAVEAPEGTLIIDKIVEGSDAAPDSFHFTVQEVSGEPFVVLSEVTEGSYQLPPGTYTVQETDGNADHTLLDGCSGVELTAEGSVTCTVTNTFYEDEAPEEDEEESEEPEEEQEEEQPLTGTLTLIKEVQNGGPLEAEDFVLQAWQDEALVETFESGDTKTLPAGSYVVDEARVDDYPLTDYSCEGAEVIDIRTIDLQPGQDATCTLINTYSPEPATVTVTKTVINEEEDEGRVRLEAEDFALFVGETPVTSGEAAEVAPGDYAVGETAVPNYTQTGLTCSRIVIDSETQEPVDEPEALEPNDDGTFTFDSGERYDCAITNDDDTGGELTPYVVVARGGLDPENIAIWIEQEDEEAPEEEEEREEDEQQTEQETGPLTALFSKAMAALIPPAHAATVITLNHNVPNPIGPGNFTVFYTQVKGYSVAITGDCSALGIVTLTEFDNQACTFTYTKHSGGGSGGGGSSPAPSLPGSLTVITNVVNDDGGAMSPADASISLVSTANPDATFPGVATPGVNFVMLPSTYLVTAPTVSGYTYVADGCSGSIGSGGSAVCTITYDDETGVTPPPAPAPAPAPVPAPAVAPIAAPVPQVLGATDSSTEGEALPRTGASGYGIALPLLLSALAAATVLRRRS